MGGMADRGLHPVVRVRDQNVQLRAFDGLDGKYGLGINTEQLDDPQVNIRLGAAYLAALGIERDGAAWESYVSDPTKVG